MAIDKISEIFSESFIESTLNGDSSWLIPIFYLIILISVYSIVIWHFYRYISKRDCFKINYSNHHKLFSFFKYFLIYPFVAFIFFTGFSIILLFITRNIEISVILSTSFAIVTAIRITAYYNEELSKDVAKMLPFAILGLFLIEPSYFSFIEIVNKIYLLPEFFSICIQFIFLIVFVEWILRFALSIKKMIFSKIHYNTNRNYRLTAH